MVKSALNHRKLIDTKALLLDMGTLLQENYHASWKCSETGAARYEKADFFEDGADSKQVSEVVTKSVHPVIWFIFVSSLYIVAIIGLRYLASKYLENLTSDESGIAVLFVGLLVSLIYLFAMKRAASFTRLAAAGKYDPYQKIIPGWGFCRIGLGSEGISIDGGHFLYLAEWRELVGARVSTDDDYCLLLLKPTGYAEEHGLSPDVPELIIPRRFFRAPGGNISWGEFKGELKQKNLI